MFAFYWKQFFAIKQKVAFCEILLVALRLPKNLTTLNYQLFTLATK